MPEPFLKWAGGQRWLVNQHSRLFPYVYGRYVEPFLGSGAVFFYLQPRDAVLSDSNAELVNVYQVLRAHPEKLQRLLHRYHKQHSSTFYYRWRRRRPSDQLHQAARFLYLNRVCFNGLFRVNLQGEFNVPIGTKTEVSYPRGYLQSVSRILQRAQVVQADFEDIINQTEV